MATGHSQPPSHGGLSSLGRRPAAPPPLLIWPSLDKPLSSPSDPSAFRKFAFSSTKTERPSSPPPWKVLPRVTEGTWGSASSIPITRSFRLQGGIEGEEDARNAAFRELKEETGVTSAEILAEVPYWLTYDFPPEAKEKLNKLWGTDWKGQAQKWFLFRFTRGEDEINLTGDGSEKPEFGEWMWMTPEQLTECAVDFKKSVYEEVLKSFKPHLRPDSDSEE